MRVYAIGDVHGRLDLLHALLQKIADDDEGRTQIPTAFVLLGDLINRGPSSRQVVELVANWPSTNKALTVLRGNHEAALISAYRGDISSCRQLHRMGIKQTLASYEADVSSYENWSVPELSDIIINTIPQEHIVLMERMPKLVQSGDYFFVHASYAAGLLPEQQDDSDLLWSRKPYRPIKGERWAVVHGHANLTKLHNETNRICVDTSAYRSSVLTAVGLEGKSRWFLSTSPSTL